MNISSRGESLGIRKSATYFFIALAISCAFFLPLQEVSINNFHPDDAGLLGVLNSIRNFQDILSFVFSTSAHKFRPVAYLQWLLEWSLAPNIKFYIFYNLVLISIIAVQIINIVNEKTNYILGIAIILVVVLSKFSLYGVWNITGSFELLSSIVFLVLIRGVTLQNSLLTLGFYSALLILISEKFLPFVVIFPFILSYVKGENLITKSNIFFGPGILLAFVGLRFGLGVPVFVGTQTDSIVDSFNFVRVLKFYIFSFFEIFGVSMGPKYLTGIDFVDWTPFAALYSDRIYMGTLIIGATVFLFSWTNFIVRCFMSSKTIKALLFIFFLMILPATITFRLELRWLFPAFLTFLILIFYNSSALNKSEDSVIGRFNYIRFIQFNAYGYLFALIIFSLNYSYHWRSELFFSGKLIGLPLLGK